LNTQICRPHLYRLICGSIEDNPNAVVPKLCSAEPKGSMTSSHKIRGYVSVMATSMFAYSLFNEEKNILLKIIEELL